MSVSLLQFARVMSVHLERTCSKYRSEGTAAIHFWQTSKSHDTLYLVKFHP